MNALVATNVVIARASARASRVSRLARAARAATAPSSIAPDNVALARARLVRCRAEGEEKDTMSSLDAILGGSQDKDAPVRAHAAAASMRFRLFPLRIRPYPSTLNYQQPPWIFQAEEPEPVKAPSASPERCRGDEETQGRTSASGTPSKPMPSNLFLNICLFISAIAIMAKLSGVLG